MPHPQRIDAARSNNRPALPTRRQDRHAAAWQNWPRVGRGKTGGKTDWEPDGGWPRNTLTATKAGRDGANLQNGPPQKKSAFT